MIKKIHESFVILKGANKTKQHVIQVFDINSISMAALSSGHGVGAPWTSLEAGMTEK